MDEAGKKIPNPYEDVTSTSGPTTPITPNSINTQAPAASGASQDTRTIVTVLLLIFIFPVGFLLMWFWSKWKVWIKVLVSVPLVLFSLLVIPAILLVAINPTAQLEKAKQMQICQNQCEGSSDTSCTTNCLKTKPSEENTLDTKDTSY